jgi:hypothetical protein
MPFLKTYWKQIAVALAIAIVFGFGYHKGYSSQKREFDAFKLQIEANAKVQKQKNDLLVKKHEKVTEDVAKDYEKAIKQLRSYYTNNRMLNNPSSGRVSKNSSATIIPDGETKSSLPDPTRDIALDCSNDVLQLLFLQKWIETQQLIQ